MSSEFRYRVPVLVIPVLCLLASGFSFPASAEEAQETHERSGFTAAADKAPGSAAFCVGQAEWEVLSAALAETQAQLAESRAVAEELRRDVENLRRHTQYQAGAPARRWIEGLLSRGTTEPAAMQEGGGVGP